MKSKLRPLSLSLLLSLSRKPCGIKILRPSHVFVKDNNMLQINMTIWSFHICCFIPLWLFGAGEGGEEEAVKPLRNVTVKENNGKTGNPPVVSAPKHKHMHPMMSGNSLKKVLSF